jgi:hypothetical protein
VSEFWRGSFTDSIDHLTSFPVPTHTHVFGSHSIGYGHLKTADVRVSQIAVKLIFQWLQNLDLISELTRTMIFKIVNFLIGLGNLMICTHDLTILTKTKETIHNCESFRYGGKCALNKCFYHSNRVSVPT